jgi:hypothetical protein
MMQVFCPDAVERMQGFRSAPTESVDGSCCFVFEFSIDTQSPSSSSPQHTYMSNIVNNDYKKRAPDDADSWSLRLCGGV